LFDPKAGETVPSPCESGFLLSTSPHIKERTLSRISNNYLKLADNYLVDFEPIRDIEESITNVPIQDVASFQSYLLRELPRFFSTVLENAVTRELHPIEERLRSELVDLMQEAQNNAFSSWRAMHQSGADSELLPPATTAQNPRVVLQQVDEMFAPLVLGPSGLETQLPNQTLSDSSDSGYSSDLTRPATSQEASSTSSHQTENQIPLRLNNMLETSQPDHQMIWENMSDSTSIIKPASSFMNSKSQNLFFPNEIVSNTLGQEQDKGLQSGLTFNDDAWAVNFDNLDLDYSMLDPS
jgi:hypothetical protein